MTHQTRKMSLDPKDGLRGCKVAREGLMAWPKRKMTKKGEEREYLWPSKATDGTNVVEWPAIDETKPRGRRFHTVSHQK